MSKGNAARIAARLEYEREKVSLADIEEYRRVHFPEYASKANTPAWCEKPPRIPGDGHIATLSHERFHRWFGTECDGTCPHARSLPTAVVRRAPWWRRLFGGSS